MNEWGQKMEIKHELKYKTLYESFFQYRNVFMDVFFMSLSVVLMGILSNIRIPLWPVPITMQTFGVFLIAFFFGSKKGTISILLYLVVGLLGLGVFAGYSSGYAPFIGPTGGYLIGFIAMVFVVGKLIEKGYGRTKKSVLLCMIIGEAILYVFGLTGLYLAMPGITLWQTLSYGFFPFIIGDSIKIGMAMPLFPYLFNKGK